MSQICACVDSQLAIFAIADKDFLLRVVFSGTYFGNVCIHCVYSYYAIVISSIFKIFLK